MGNFSPFNAPHIIVQRSGPSFCVNREVNAIPSLQSESRGIGVSVVEYIFSSSPSINWIFNLERELLMLEILKQMDLEMEIKKAKFLPLGRIKTEILKEMMMILE